MSVEKETVKLSLMPCYAGSWQAEVMTSTPDPGESEEPHFYLQFVEGCGYSVYSMTPDEAEKVAMNMLAGVKRIRGAAGPTT